jgi:hypothetical protein
MTPTLILTFVFLAAQTAFAQKPGSCTNPSIQWTINPIYVDGTTPNAVQSDGSPYIDGQPGVSAVVHVCSGTYDAILLLSKSRSLSFSFAKLLASNSYTPSWALSGTTQSGAGGFTVHNLFFVPSGTDRNQEYTFTTRGGGTTSGSWNLSMVNPSPDAPSSLPNRVAIANTPYPDSLVIVHHCPANVNTSTCPNITHETWFAYPDPNPTASGVGQNGLPITQVGSLLISSHGTEVNAGEFSMPFSFTISLLN